MSDAGQHRAPVTWPRPAAWRHSRTARLPAAWRRPVRAQRHSARAWRRIPPLYRRVPRALRRSVRARRRPARAQRHSAQAWWHSARAWRRSVRARSRLPRALPRKHRRHVRRANWGNHCLTWQPITKQRTRLPPGQANICCAPVPRKLLFLLHNIVPLLSLSIVRIAAVRQMHPPTDGVAAAVKSRVGIPIAIPFSRAMRVPSARPYGISAASQCRVKRKLYDCRNHLIHSLLCT